jgi:integrase
MVFKARGANTFKLKISIPTRNQGKPRTFSTGSTVRGVADDLEHMVLRMKGGRRWEPLELVFDGSLTLAEVYDADIRGTLDARLAEFTDADLDPLVTEWATRANPKYVRQVRRLIVEGERFPASRFRRKAISEFLAKLKCDDPTKNRYRAALSVFAKWLVEREVLDTNPVRDVAMYKEHDPRMVWMTWDESWEVAQAAPSPYRALFALMAATGMELGAALRVKQSDIDFALQTVHARGSKTQWRNRVVRCELWAIAELAAISGDTIGPVPLFPGIGYKDALDTFKSAQKAVGLSGHRLHDLRHTYAVNALKKGYKPTVVAFQLGHKNASMVIKCYGRFVPDASDYQAGSATKAATKTSRKTGTKRA